MVGLMTLLCTGVKLKLRLFYSFDFWMDILFEILYF